VHSLRVQPHHTQTNKLLRVPADLSKETARRAAGPDSKACMCHVSNNVQTRTSTSTEVPAGRLPTSKNSSKVGLRSLYTVLVLMICVQQQQDKQQHAESSTQPLVSQSCEHKHCTSDSPGTADNHLQFCAGRACANRLEGKLCRSQL
jgi:hypothetical protein